MRRIVGGILVGVLLVGISFAGLSAKPLLIAHGEFWTDMHRWGQWYDIQLAFNVQDRGEEDHGSLSLRLFDHRTGELLDVFVSTEVFDVHIPEEGGVAFVARLRSVKGLFPLPAAGISFWAYDGGGAEPDQFRMIGPLPIYRGNIVIR
jgi:hypothetical protein